MTNVGGSGGTDLPQPIRDYLASLTPEQRQLLKEVREKLAELRASDTMKAQVV